MELFVINLTERGVIRHFTPIGRQLLNQKAERPVSFTWTSVFFNRNSVRDDLSGKPGDGKTKGKIRGGSEGDIQILNSV
jgi:hypothetical protein